MRLHSADRGDLLVLTEPFLNLDGGFVNHVNVNSQVLEGLGQGSPGALKNKTLFNLHSRRKFIVTNSLP